MVVREGIGKIPRKRGKITFQIWKCWGWSEIVNYQNLREKYN